MFNSSGGVEPSSSVSIVVIGIYKKKRQSSPYDMP
jgi:hypothetical protein